MGSTESKMVEVSTPKPESIQPLKFRRVAELADPRSPSGGIDRTPIQVGGATSGVIQAQSVGPMCFDPRSPTPGIVRTPLKDSMKVTVTSLARRLSTFFLNDVAPGESVFTTIPPASFTKHPSLSSVQQQDVMNSTEPLISPQSHDSLSAPTDCPSTPRGSSLGYGSFCSSPFVVVGEAQVEADADITLDEGEEALLLGSSPLDKELSLSMLACREGVYSPEYYPSAEERPSTPLPPSDDTLSLIISETHQPASPVQQAILPPAQEVECGAPAVPEQGPVQTEEPKILVPEPVNTSSNSEIPLPAFKFPKFDPCSPSQVVFKPQWLGKGFGSTGVRARGVQNRSSPLSSRKPSIDENENKVVLTKQKQRGKALIAEGRSPLQVLKETNSPRKNTQMKLKVSTPEKQRFGQVDRRALILSLNKENQ